MKLHDIQPILPWFLFFCFKFNAALVTWNEANETALFSSDGEAEPPSQAYISQVTVHSPLLSISVETTKHDDNAGAEDSKRQTACRDVGISENEVHDYLFTKHNVGNGTGRAKMRPRRNASETVHVGIALKAFSIRDFREREGILILHAYIALMWQDDYLNWQNIYPYNCVSRLLINAGRVWLPDYAFLSGTMDIMHRGVEDDSEVDDEEEEQEEEDRKAANDKVSLYYDGFLEYYPMGEIWTNCEIDLSLFPFDTQECEIILESWNFPSNMQSYVLQDKPFVAVPNLWMDNKLWDLIDNKSQILHQQYNPPDGPTYDRVIFKMYLKRKPMFYYVNIIIPSIIIAVVEIVVFLIPIQEAGKVETSFTCLLAYSVFQTMILDEMPKSSHEVPLLSIYIDLQMAYIGVIAICGQGLVLMLLRKGLTKPKKPPPSFVLTFAEYVGRYTLLGKLNLSKYGLSRNQRKREKARRSMVSHQFMPGEFPEEQQNLMPRHVSLTYIEQSERGSKLEVSSKTDRRPSTSHFGNSQQPQPMETSMADSVVVYRHHQNRHLRPSSQVSADDSGSEVASFEYVWIYLAEVLERCNMLLYIAAISLTPIILFSYIPAENRWNFGDSSS